MSDPDSQTPTRSWGRVLLLVVALALVGGAAWWFFLRPEEASVRGFGNYTFGDPARIYLGRAALARRPAVVDSSRVYAAIPEYAQVVAEGLDSDAPRYHFLMVEASKRFKAALSAAARAAGFDVVAETGTVRPAKPGVEDPPDLTDDVLSSLR